MKAKVTATVLGTESGMFMKGEIIDISPEQIAALGESVEVVLEREAVVSEPVVATPEPEPVEQAEKTPPKQTRARK